MIRRPLRIAGDVLVVLTFVAVIVIAQHDRTRRPRADAPREIK